MHVTGRQAHVMERKNMLKRALGCHGDNVTVRGCSSDNFCPYPNLGKIPQPALYITAVQQGAGHSPVLSIEPWLFTELAAYEGSNAVRYPSTTQPCLMVSELLAGLIQQSSEEH